MFDINPRIAVNNMPLYLLRFKIETCLSAREDLSIDFKGNSPLFLFSKKTIDDNYVIAELRLDAKNNRDAWDQAAGSVLPPIVDSLCFATGTPLLIRDCELVLKDESGNKQRRALYIGHRRVARSVPLRAAEIREMKQILEKAEGLSLPLCWHRYALDRKLALEQFVFNWLAFEALAGDTDVVTRCPKCQSDIEHCGIVIRHRGSSKLAARKIFQEAYPGTTDKDFNEKIWSKARNSVFHGKRYPDPMYLTELDGISQKVHTAADKHTATRLKLEVRERPHYGYETLYRHFLFIEWTTAHPAERFAPDWPAKHLAAMTAEEEPGNAHYAAAAAGVNLLNYQTESPEW